MLGSSRAGLGARLATACGRRGAVPAAALIFGLAVASAAVASGAAERPGHAALRPAPPSSADLAVPARELVDGRAPRRGARQMPPRPNAARRRLFPASRLVAVYGAPQLSATIVGQTSPAEAADEAVRLATRFSEVAEPSALPGIDLIATIATADRGSDGLYRFRQDPDLIDAYLAATREAGGRLVVDVQPGRARFIREVKALEPWLLQPDVDVALDPEWNVGRRGVPGVTEGKVTAKQLNKVSRYMARLVTANGLPQKALFVHQFREGSVRKRARVAQRGGAVAVTLNFDGIGSPEAKTAGYRALSRPGLFNGFSVFVSRDDNVMGFERIAALEPPPDYVMYQ